VALVAAHKGIPFPEVLASLLHWRQSQSQCILLLDHKTFFPAGGVAFPAGAGVSNLEFIAP
jgi:hypothetical protein